MNLEENRAIRGNKFVRLYFSCFSGLSRKVFGFLEWCKVSCLISEVHQKN